MPVLDRIPAEDLPGPFHRDKGTSPGGNHLLGNGPRRPAVTALKRPHRSVLVVEIKLVAAGADNLRVDFFCCVAGQKNGQLGDLIGALALLAQLQLLGRAARHRLDHATHGVRRNAVGADIEPCHVSGDAA